LNFEREKGPATVMSAGCRPRQRQRSGHSYSRQKNIQYSRSAPAHAEPNAVGLMKVVVDHLAPKAASSAIRKVRSPFMLGHSRKQTMT
jgi:hypothetical protein